jgi:hypothetical protein
MPVLMAIPTITGPPGPVVGARDQGGHDGGSDTGHETDREVDLAQEKGEHLRRPEQDEEGRLADEVDQVEGAEEMMVLGLEDHHDEDEAGQDGQRAALPASDPQPPGAYVLAESVSQELGVEGGHPADRVGSGLGAKSPASRGTDPKDQVVNPVGTVRTVLPLTA